MEDTPKRDFWDHCMDINAKMFIINSTTVIAITPDPPRIEETYIK